MSGYTEVEQLPIPEVSLEDRDALIARFASVVAGELPGFVMRQVGIDDNDALGWTMTNRLLTQVDPDVSIHKSGKTMRFGGSKPSCDSQFHVDFNDAEMPDTQVNFYIVTKGTVLSSLVPFTPARREHIQKSMEDVRFEPTDQDQAEFRRRRVRRQIFTPQMHTAALAQGDGLVFTDALHAHKFESIVLPRYSIANILHAHVP